MNIIHNIQQGSPEWLELRLGKITGSRFGDLMKNGRGGAPSKTAESYLIELATQAVTGIIPEQFENDAMRHGTETEPRARAMYELMSGNEVSEVAFIEYNDLIGVSPDGLVGINGGLEIKCPSSKVQAERYLNQVGLPDEYKYQVHGCIWVAEREWWDFVSFDDRFDTKAQYICTRVNRDKEIITELSEKVLQAAETLQEMIQKLSVRMEY